MHKILSFISTLMNILYVIAVLLLADSSTNGRIMLTHILSFTTLLNYVLCIQRLPLLVKLIFFSTVLRSTLISYDVRSMFE